MDESLALLSTLAVAIAGVNIIWGIFLYPWGFIGFAFAAVDVYLFFLAQSIRRDYDERDYENALKRMHVFILAGFICGLIILGLIAYKPFRELDDIITKKYLIKGTPGKVFGPPQFPGKKK